MATDLLRRDIVDIDLSGEIVRGRIGAHTFKVLGQGDILGDRLGVNVYRDGEAVTLTDVTVTGYLINASGQTVPITGTASGQTAYVDLTAACCVYAGAFSLAIVLTAGGITRTVRIIDGEITRTATEIIIDPGSVTPSYQELLAIIGDCETATAAATAAASAANAAAESTVKSNEQQAVNFGKLTNNTVMRAAYQTGRFIASGFSASSKYARSSLPFPAGVYSVSAYSPLTSRACQYVSNSEGTWLTSSWANTAYVVIATGPWYVNFASSEDLADSDIAAIESNFVIERLETGTAQEDAGFLKAGLDGYEKAADAPISDILAPDMEPTEVSYRLCAKKGNRVYLKAVNPSSGTSQMMSITGDQVRPKEMTPSGASGTTAYTADLGNLVPIANFRPIQITVYNKNRFSDTHASRVQIRFYSVGENDAITYISSTSMEMGDALGKALASDGTVPEGATHFEIVVYTRGTLTINTDSYMVIKLDYAQPRKLDTSDIDANLSVTGKAADAKAVGDALAALNAAVFSVDAKGTEKVFTYTDGKYIDGEDGAAKDATGFEATDYINVTAGQKLMFSYPYFNGSAMRLLAIGFAWYDSSKAYISGGTYLSAFTAHAEDTVVTAPASAAYVRFTKDTAINGNNFYVADVVTLTLKEYIDAKIAALAT